MIDVLGYVAALFTTFSLLPQVIRIWKLKEARDISLFMPLMVSIGAVLWLVYGIMLAAPPVIAANAVSLLVALLTLIITIKYR